MKKIAKIGMVVGALCICALLLKVVWAMLGGLIKIAMIVAICYGVYTLIKTMIRD